ncbi:TPA_asm: RNA-directed RNA polymerase [ssRNA phage SRR6960799_12]|uniref:RNA-directed RNA polymerase n=1 Tax=ssRNA phage SRR6960799_12 TaxID=2786568 RepID=A0A8S5L4L8_9VIRU|nr:RNA-directed RNA polymerase [ssRNA phage SRR6960799_12]DAD52295.1 TPA_asm: RNA-directed RNA polymerase [ssRNA phage SRR6960799_12]
MGKRFDHLDLSCIPVDPLVLFNLLADCLLLRGADAVGEITSRDFPSVSSENFRDEYLLKEVLRKFPGFDLGINTRAVALEAFLADETINAETNDRLQDYDVENPHVRQIMTLAARKAVTVLGAFRKDWLLDGVRFGPGATTRLGGETVNVMQKLSGTPHVTLSAYSLADAFLKATPQWGSRLGLRVDEDAYVPSGDYSDLRTGPKLLIRELDKLTTVSKNAVTDRTIGIGPCMNIYLQLGVGYAMRKRMYPWGINLSDQTINQRRAREGSITGRIATLDIKSASNSVTRGLVWHMLGNHSHDARNFDPTWFEVMNKLRTQGCWIDGKVHEYELFSAMGNGFTFELESLIFWSLACATCAILALPEDVAVYGDDITMPVEAVPLFTEVLAFAGFRLNSDKSFSTTEGPLFRESCGRHYLDGKDVTPFYIDAGLDTPDQIMLLANNIVRWCKQDDGTLDGRLLPLWSFVVNHLSSDLQKIGIPFSEDANDGLILPFDAVRPSIAYLGNPVIGTTMRPPRGQLAVGYRIKTISWESRETKPTGHVGLVCWLYNAEKRRFSAPREEEDPFLKIKRNGAPRPKVAGCIPSLIVENLRMPRHESPSPSFTQVQKVPKDTRKRTLKVKSRIVRSWTDVGPWVVWKSESLVPLGSNS